MTVFKAYLKILFNHKWRILTSFFIFIAITLFFIKAPQSNNSKIPVVLINDGVSEVVFDGLSTHLSTIATFKDINNNELDIKSALFFRDIEYAATISSNFTVKTLSVPNSTTSFIVDQSIDAYFNTLTIYQNNGLSEQEAVNQTIKDLSNHVTIELLNQTNGQQSKTSLMTFFNYYVYGFVGVIMASITSVMLSFNQSTVFNRTALSSTSIKKRNMLLFISHIMLGLSVCTLFGLVSILVFKEIRFSFQHLMFLINSLTFMIPIVALSFLVGTTVRKKEAISAVNTSLSLILSFISGAFVPLYLLSPVIVKIAQFFPAYWYIKANELILASSHFDLMIIKDYLLVQLLFGVAYMSIAIAFSKQKAMKRELTTKLS